MVLGGVPSASGPASAQKEIKSDMTHDRDGNGQELYQKQQKKKQKMTREQAVAAVSKMNAKQFMKDMSWTVDLVEDEGYFFALVVDSSANVIRKISEFDLWDSLDASYLNEKETSKGNLLRRTA